MDRKKELARQRYQRQEQRRQAQEARARLVRIVGSVLAVALIAGGAGAIILLTGEDEKSNAAADAAPSPAANDPQDGAPKQAISMEKVTVSGGGGGTAKCEYPDSEDQGAPKDLGKPPSTAKHKGNVDATVKTSLGDLKLRLDAGKAPCAVNSFAFLAEKKFYEKSKCHRLTGGGLSVLQCGDPTGTGSGGPGYRYGYENTKGAKYTRGTLAMAHSQMPDSNGSQFFIVYKDSQLPPEYTVFGKITSGMEIVDKVANAGVAAQ
jgi:peptidyl-prolyl cis-trans isomerase B (cyclophilin B)